MTKKDYILIADAICDVFYTFEFNKEQIDTIIYYIGRRLRMDNPNFSIKIFIDYIEKIIYPK